MTVDERAAVRLRRLKAAAAADFLFRLRVRGQTPQAREQRFDAEKKAFQFSLLRSGIAKLTAGSEDDSHIEAELMTMVDDRVGYNT